MNEFMDQLREVKENIMGAEDNSMYSNGLEVHYEQQDDKDGDEQESEISIEINPHSKFEALSSAMLTSTFSLAVCFNTLFKPMINGYVGTTIRRAESKDGYNYLNPLICTMYLEFVPEDKIDPSKITAVRTVKADINGDIKDQISLFNNATKNKTLILTKDGMSLIRPFARNTVSGKKEIKWGDIISQVVDKGYTGPGYKYLLAIQIDAIKFIKKIYGNRTESGKNFFDYRLTIIRDIPPDADMEGIKKNYYGNVSYYNMMGNYPNNMLYGMNGYPSQFIQPNMPVDPNCINYLITIERLDGDALEESVKKYAPRVFTPNINSLGIITATM